MSYDEANSPSPLSQARASSRRLRSARLMTQRRRPPPGGPASPEGAGRPGGGPASGGGRGAGGPPAPTSPSARAPADATAPLVGGAAGAWLPRTRSPLPGHRGRPSAPHTTGFRTTI